MWLSLKRHVLPAVVLARPAVLCAGRADARPALRRQHMASLACLGPARTPPRRHRVLLHAAASASASSSPAGAPASDAAKPKAVKSARAPPAAGGSAAGGAALPATVDYTTMVAAVAECKALAVRPPRAPLRMVYLHRARGAAEAHAAVHTPCVSPLSPAPRLPHPPARAPAQVPARVQSVTLADENTLVLGLRTLESKAWLHLSWHVQAARACLGPPPPLRPDTDAFSFRDVLKASLVGQNLIDAAMLQARARAAMDASLSRCDVDSRAARGASSFALRRTARSLGERKPSTLGPRNPLPLSPAPAARPSAAVGARRALQLRRPPRRAPRERALSGGDGELLEPAPGGWWRGAAGRGVPGRGEAVAGAVAGGGPPVRAAAAAGGNLPGRGASGGGVAGDAGAGGAAPEGQGGRRWGHGARGPADALASPFHALLTPSAGRARPASGCQRGLCKLLAQGFPGCMNSSACVYFAGAGVRRREPAAGPGAPGRRWPAGRRAGAGPDA